MVKCPERGYRAEASSDWFTSAAVYTSLVVCPSCDSVLGGFDRSP
jgi:hypothetical protein